MRKRFQLIACGFLVITASPVFAGIVGKVVGKVTDASTGEELVGANVVIDGTAYGAAVDAEGSYYIVNIDVGRYTLKASMMGYNTVVKDDVRISADLTTSIDFELQPAAIKMKGVTVKAKRPMVIPDATSTTRISSGKDIESRPTPDYKDALAAEAGVSFSKGGTSQRTKGFHIRGGRGSEVAYLVDGMSVQDRLSASSYWTTDVEVATNAIQEMQVMTGGFSAEYGQAMSGVVNIITKEGRKTEGIVRVRTDVPFTGTRDEGIKQFDASIGGPSPISKKLLFFASGALQSRDQNQHWDFALPNTDREFYSTQGKLTYKLTPSLKGVVSGFLSREQFGNSGTWPGTEAYEKYVPPEFKWASLRKLSQLQGTITHSVTSKVFYDLKAGYFTSHNTTAERDFEWEDKRKWYEDYRFRPWWTYCRPRYSDYRGAFWDDKYEDPEYPHTGTAYAGDDSVYYYPHGVPGMFSMGEPSGMEERETNYWGLKWDATSQINKHQQIKFGTDWRIYDLRRLEMQYIYYNDGVVPILDGTGQEVGLEIEPGERKVENALYWNKYEVTPYEGAIYIQDKIEYPGFVINAGLRWDYFEPEAWKYNDPTAPYERVIVEADTVIVGPDTVITIVDDSLAPVTTTAEAKHQFSPRFGISFPVTERTVFRLSYGHFFQMPLLRYMYDSHNLNLIETSGAWPLIGNPESEHQKTVQYEFGVAHQLAEQLAVDVTIFYKDMYGLLGTRHVSNDFKDYSWYTVQDYGNVKGVEFVLRKRAAEWWSGQATYTLQFADGTCSYAREAYYDYIANVPIDPITGEQRSLPKTVHPLEFDERHVMTTEFRLSIPDRIRYLRGTFFNLTNDIGSGTPYTKRDSNGDIDGVTNAERMPWRWTTDLRAEKMFGLFGQKLKLFAEVKNLLNRKNTHSVYSMTGDPYDPGTILSEAYYIENSFPSGYQDRDRVPVYEEGGEHGYQSADERRDLDNDGYITKKEFYQSYQNAWYDRHNEPWHFNGPLHINIGISIAW
jgi:outer membrane receptor protein involved in Fe transport